MAHKEARDFFNVMSQNNLTPKNEAMAYHSKLGSIKRPLTTCDANYSQPSISSKRCRKNSLSSSDPDTFEMNTTNSFDPEFSCSSNNSESFSPSHQSQQCRQQQQPPIDEAAARNHLRLLRTTEMLKESGVYDVAVQTAALIRQNQQSRKELEELREETKIFLKDVLNNPENKKICQILNGLDTDLQNQPNSFILDPSFSDNK